MKLQTPSSKALASALSKSQKCISSKNSIAILNDVLLTKDNAGNFFFTSANQSAQLTIPAPFNVVEGEFTEPVCLPVAVISSFLSTLPDCVLTFSFGEGESMALGLEYCTEVNGNVKSGKVSLTYQSGAEYPHMAQPTGDVLSIKLPAGYFLGMAEEAQNFIKKDELRPVMECLNIDVVEDYSECVLVASNGTVLIRSIYSNDPQRGGGDFYISGKPRNILLHSQYFRPLSVFDGCEEIHIESDDSTIRLTSGDVEYICKRIEGRYPAYNSVIPKNVPFFIEVDRKELLAIIKRVSLFSPETSNLITLKKEGMFLTVSADNADFSRAAQDQVLILNSTWQDGEVIGFGSQNLANTINAIDAQTVRISLTDATRPATATEAAPAPTLLTLCMPMMITE